VLLVGTVAAAGFFGAAGPVDRTRTPARAVAAAPLSDRFGDPLPNGAVARLGSVRLRHAGLSEYVCLEGGKTVLTAGSDRVLRYWDKATGRQVRERRLQGKAGPGALVTLAPDGKTLVAVEQGRLVFWEVESGKVIKTLPAPKARAAYLWFS